MDAKAKKFDPERIAELEKQLALEKEKYNFIKDLINCGLWEYDIKEKKLIQSKGLEGLVGGEIPNYRETIKNSNSIYSQDIPVFDKYVDSMDNGDETFSYEMRMITEADQFAWVRFEGYTVKDAQGNPVKVIGRTLDIDKEKNAESVVIKKAESDNITGLLTGEAFLSKMSNSLAKSGEKVRHALLVIDINNFGAINKAWGESYGEYVLEVFGAGLASLFKEGDAVARIQGDAFGVFKRGIHTAKDVVELSKNIVDMAEHLTFKREHELKISIGVSIFPNDGKDYSTLYKKASIALQAAKNSPDKVCEFYATSLANKPHVVKQTETQQQTTQARQIIHEQKQAQYGKVEKYFVDRVMEMLASDETDPAEINTVLAELGKYYRFVRVYTYNYDKRGNVCSVKYYWNGKTIPYMRVYERIVDAQWESIYARFSNDSLFICENSSRLDFEIPGELTGVFMPASLMQYKINEDANSVTCISFERPLSQGYTKEEQEFLINISKLLGIYMDRIRNKEMLSEEIEYSRDVMVNQQVTNYGVYKDSYKLVFLGDAEGRQYIAEEDNLLCYKTVMGRKTPCKNCPLTGIRQGKERCAMENYFEKNQKWFTSTATQVKHGGKEYDFICWTDVTAFVDRMKSKDILTGQMTVDKFEKTVEAKISMLRKPQNIFVYFNIPDFSEINDLWGYSVCDEVLILFAAAIKEELKAEEYLARVTGSTFVMFIDYDDKDRLAARVEMMFQQAIRAVHRMYPDVKLTVWSGLYRMSGHGTPIPEMIEYANTARKSIAARAEHNEIDIAFYSDVINKGATFESFVRTNMQSALENHEFRVFFQPKRNDEGEIIMADAVVRWVTKEGQVIERESFREIMEEDGFIRTLDAYIHEETFKLLYEWIERQITPPVISLACSWQYMFSPEFMNRTKQILEKYPVPTSLVEFVIPEGVNEGNFYRVVSILQELQTMGFVISLDSYMTKFALNSMKDRFPVKMLEENPGINKLDDIQVEVKDNKPLNADDFATELHKK
ncbi:MAG: diguanylate cyclase domain-containing protein [Lachnospiraceae bacterium]